MDGTLYLAHVMAAQSMFGKQALEPQFLALCMAVELTRTHPSRLTLSHFHLMVVGLFQLQDTVSYTYGMQNQVQ
jgi:hypothetical protein